MGYKGVQKCPPFSCTEFHSSARGLCFWFLVSGFYFTYSSASGTIACVTMQRRVSLVVSDHSNRGQGSNNETPLFRENVFNPDKQESDIFPKSKCAIKVGDIDNETHAEHNKDAVLKCPSNLPLKHSKSWCILNSNIAPSIPKPRQKIISADDLEAATPYMKLERKGSVPMIGSLVYYKYKSDPNTAFNNKHNKNFTTLGRNSRLPRSESLNDFTKHIDNDDSTLRSVDLTDDAITDEDDSSNSSSNKILSNDKDSDNEHHRHFSCPVTLSENDEFNLINSKIHSRIKHDAEILRRHLRDERKKVHFTHKNFRIPGIDSTDSLSSPESTSLHNSHSNSMAQLSAMNNTNNTDNTTPPEVPRNRRHRRRLTCAMIFTSPKVVEI